MKNLKVISRKKDIDGENTFKRSLYGHFCLKNLNSTLI